ncbi:hypothetical protein DWV00_29630 [Trinickia dinghuensis]|uniref:Uncharacterized protein n=1 Tax=Trinickia dinghuensis TaxID=2291023 RepID=A0A3D8JRN9_9BURK|nr:hypothetical protein DWV00_29630 [Trinickia dinghuensis]
MLGKLGFDQVCDVGQLALLDAKTSGFDGGLEGFGSDAAVGESRKLGRVRDAGKRHQQIAVQDTARGAAVAKTTASGARLRVDFVLGARAAAAAVAKYIWGFV